MARLRLGVIGAGSWTVSSHLPFLAAHRDEVEFTINRGKRQVAALRVAECIGQVQFRIAVIGLDQHDVGVGVSAFVVFETQRQA